MAQPLHILGIDGGLAHMGVAVAVVPAGGQATVVHTEVIETTKTSIGTAAADNVRRAREVALRLDEVIAQYPVSRIVAEAMSHPRNARAAAMLSVSWGVVAALAQRHRLAVDVKSPMALKRAVTGNPTAGKADVIQAVLELYPEVSFALLRRDLHEHAADAVAAIHAFYGKGSVPADSADSKPARARVGTSGARS